MKRFLSCILIFFFLLLTSTAQEVKRFHVNSYNTDNGLPANGIKGLQWDEATGFLWIATEAGIVRYNGIEFKSFTNLDNPYISNERILFLVKNNAGKIFTAENSGNIFEINKNKIIFSEKKKITNNSRSNVILKSVSEVLYNKQNEFSRPGSFSTQFDKLLPYGDTAGFIIHNNGVYFYTHHFSSPAHLKESLPPIRTGFKTGGDFYLVDFQNQVYLFDPVIHQLTKIFIEEDSLYPMGAFKNNLYAWENGMSNPILFNKENAWELTGKNGKLKTKFICNNIPADILIRYVQWDDKSKTLFIGTDSKGILIINQNRVESKKATAKGSNQRTSYYSQIELPDGNILTNEGHVIGSNVARKETWPVSGKFSNSVFFTNDSLLWFSQFPPAQNFICLNKINLINHTRTVYEKIRLGNEIAIASTNNQVYIAEEKGIFRLSGDSLQTLYLYGETDYPRVHYDMKEIKPGVLAIANCNSLLRFDTRTNKLDTIYNTGNYCVRNIWLYNDYLFFGTYGNGLFVYKNGSVKPLPLDKNNYLMYTHCLINDELGYLWISTNKGLFKTSLAEFINAAEYPKTSSVYYYYLGRKDGMDMTELNGGCSPCALRLRNKIISFPTMDGLLWVNPEKADVVLPEGEIFIDEISADNHSFQPGSGEMIILSPKTNEIIIRLSFSAWCNKENIYLDYQLNDILAWKPVKTDQGATIQLQNLPPGDYTLRIRKRNGFGINNFAYKTLSFHVTVPWYKKWWFNFLLLLAIGALVLLYVNLRTRQLKLNQQRLERQVTEKTKELQDKNEVLEKNNSIKTRLISIISHDIVTPLKFLTAAGKNLLERRKLMPDDLQEETLKEITNTSQELQLLSTNILNWIKYQNEHRLLVMENFNVHELVEQVMGILKSLAKNKNIALENDVDPELMMYQYFEPLKILIYNLITNAINFTEQGKIIIDAKKENGNLEIRVQDNGLGMTPDQVQRLMEEEIIITSTNIDRRRGHGLGYLIIKDLLKMMEGKIHIESEKGKGTTVTIILSLDNA